ncbi:MAG: hypothetical protein H0Z33_03110 [Bacillaceae bacterium]|nr:hypothetical protein [Bacillaceae bacterium]
MDFNRHKDEPNLSETRYRKMILKKRSEQGMERIRQKSDEQLKKDSIRLELEGNFLLGYAPFDLPMTDQDDKID